MPDIVESFCDPATVEGEQVIMSLQCSRFLVKSAAQAKTNPELVLGSVKYLLEPPITQLPFGDWSDAKPGELVAMFRDRARIQATKLQERFALEQAKGTFDTATNATAIIGYKAAGCHSAYITISRNLDALNNSVKPKDVNIYNSLLNLFELNALVQIKDNLADWFHCMTMHLVDSLMDRVHALLDIIRPDAVGLVDALGWDDEQLKSTLGRYDGNVYEAIYGEARLSPLNQSPKMVGWESLSKVLDLDFVKAGIGQRVLASDSNLNVNVASSKL